MNFVNKKTKRIRRKSGDVLKIDLLDGKHTYAHVSKIDPLVIFYEYIGNEDISLNEIIKLPVAFKIWVYKDVITSGRWPRIGNIFSDELMENPYFYKQDSISGKLYIHHVDFIDSNYERLATLSEIEGLECAAVWDWGDVEERLNDHFGNKDKHWMRELAVDMSKLPNQEK